MIVPCNVLTQFPRKLSHVQIPKHVREFVTPIDVHVVLESQDKSKEILETTTHGGTVPFCPPGILQNMGKGRPQAPRDSKDRKRVESGGYSQEPQWQRFPNLNDDRCCGED